MSTLAAFDRSGHGQSKGSRPVLLAALAAIGVLGAWVRPARAQAGGSAICGPNCAAPGRVVLCNDSISGTGIQSINCGALFVTGEAACSTFAAPPGAFVRAVYAVLGPLNLGGIQFDLEVYPESGVATPGPRISPAVANSYSLEGDPGRFQLVDVSSLGDVYPVSGEFRVCLRKQFDESHNVCMDSDGESGDNWIYDVVGRRWLDPSPLPGDFLIRPEIEVDDLTPWLPGGACDAPDAGTSSDATSDSGTPLDAMPSSDADASVGDAGPPTDANSSEDASSLTDATSVRDAMPTDGSAPADSGTAVDAGAAPSPEISAVSPSKGSTSVPTDLIVTGRGFAAGLALRIGQIPATEISLLGSTTINAVVPAHIAAGVYDVVVINPDGQSAIAKAAFEVLGDGNEAPPEDDCSCREARRSQGRWPWFALLAAIATRRARRGRS
ncbi:MAG: IPT/TIG domain-containing protein [Deltaproteobacteria bacterium]|nr:IPT/TIG domain-containing protein [Deltaproteobacteria bacterium]